MIKLLEHLLSSLFSHTLSGILNRMQRRETQKSKRTQNTIRLSKASAITGMIWFGVFCFFGILGFRVGISGDTLEYSICGILFLCISLPGFFRCIAHWNFRISWDDHSITTRNLFRQTSSFDWSTLQEVQKHGSLVQLRFSTGTMRFFCLPEFLNHENLLYFLNKLKKDNFFQNAP